MINTVNQVFEGVRGLLGDTRTPGGTRYTNARLRRLGFAQTAYTELFTTLQNRDLDKVRRTRYHILPAYTTVLYPATASIDNFGDILRLAERGFESANSVSVTGATPAPTSGYCDVTVTGHPFVEGQRLSVAGLVGLSDDVNGLWMVSKPDSNTVRLNGCRASGTWTSGGKVTYSSESFVEGILDRVDRLNTGSASPETRLKEYAWEDDRWLFHGASEARELEIMFYVSGSFPAGDNDSIGIDDAGGYLTYKIAALAGSKDMPELAATWDAQAIGSRRDVSKDIGGFLGSLLRGQERDKQKEGPVQRPGFRSRRIWGRRRGGLIGW